MGKLDVILILGAIVLVLFGAKQLPKLARSVGESVHELKSGFGLTPPTTSDTAARGSSEQAVSTPDVATKDAAHHD